MFAIRESNCFDDKKHEIQKKARCKMPTDFIAKNLHWSFVQMLKCTQCDCFMGHVFKI